MDVVRNEHGQATVTMLAVVAVALLLVIAITNFGSAVVHRAQARTAADAVALAAVVDSSAAGELSSWYRERGISLSFDSSSSHARSGASQAGAWAELVGSEVRVAPALVAIVARAEQLLGESLTPLHMIDTRATFHAHDAEVLDSIATELGLCPVSDDDAVATSGSFELC